MSKKSKAADELTASDETNEGATEVANTKQKIMRRNITKSLPVKLTDEEVLKYGRDVARAVADKGRIEIELDSVKVDYKGKISEQEGIIGKLSPRIHSGIETREVKCEEIKDYVKGTVTVTRLDTFDIIEDRPMREDEKQIQLQV